MAQAKIHYIQKTRADQGICGRCGVDIKKGDPYIWWSMGYRSGRRGKRCPKPECYPRPSERETSMMAEIMAYQEQFDVTTADYDDIEADLTELIDCALDLAERYRASGTNSHGSEWHPEYIARAEVLESLSTDRPYLDSEPDDGEYEDEWLERIRAEATEWVHGIEIP